MEPNQSLIGTQALVLPLTERRPFLIEDQLTVSSFKAQTVIALVSIRIFLNFQANLSNVLLAEILAICDFHVFFRTYQQG